MVREHLTFPPDADFNEFLTEYQSESDRAAAVLAGAYLDDQLKTLLLGCFVDTSTKCVELVSKPNAPLGTFSSRIAAAYATGLITEAERFDLDQIRDIRNAFAHKLHGLGFSDQSIADKCRTFQCVKEAFERLPHRFESYPREPRKLFHLCAALLAYYLRRRQRNAERWQPARPPLWRMKKDTEVPEELA